MPPSHVAVFDLDGTLTDSCEVDEECFVAAVEEMLGIDRVDTDWEGYAHCTDRGIAAEIWRRYRAREADDAELDELRRRFVARLAAAARATPERFRPVPGAAAMLERLGRRGWAVAVATGGWSSSARLKLAAAGLPADLPLVSSDRLHAREEIVGAAIESAAAHHGVAAFGRIVLIGDGSWDVRTARAMELPFVGVGSEERAARLRAAGAAVVLPDWRDLGTAHEALETAGPPAPAAAAG